MQLCMRLISLVFLTFASSALQAQHSKLLLMGSFHFANPGLDTIKNKQIDVSQPAPQAYIRQLVAQLAKFQPNVVMLEYDPKDEEKINQRYQQYLAGEYQLPINEMYQIGFRLAQQAGLKRVYSADEREVQWQGDELINYMQQQDQQAMANFQQLTSHMQQTLQTDFDQLSLQQMLVKINQAPYEKMNRNIYLQLNATGNRTTLLVPTLLRVGGIETSGCTPGSSARLKVMLVFLYWQVRDTHHSYASLWKVMSLSSRSRLNLT